MTIEQLLSATLVALLSVTLYVKVADAIEGVAEVVEGAHSRNEEMAHAAVDLMGVQGEPYQAMFGTPRPTVTVDGKLQVSLEDAVRSDMEAREAE